MEVTHTLIDIDACKAAGDNPVCIIDRGKGEIWFVPETPLDVKRRPTWEYYRQQDKVLISLFPYVTSTSPEMAMAFAFSLAFAVAGWLPKPPRKLHIAIGTPIEQVDIPGRGQCLRVWLGFGFTEE